MPLNNARVPSDFNDRLYYQLNPDVADAGWNARKHYCLYGQSEGRQYKFPNVPSTDLPKDFDERVYLELNPDVAAAGVNAAFHYLGYGQQEGRNYKKPSRLRTLLANAPRLRQALLSNLSIALSSAYSFNKPIWIFLEVTNRCNLACTICGRTHDPRYDTQEFCGDLTLERVKKLGSIFPYAEYVIPTGVGEPFLNKELMPIIRYLKKKGPPVSITSNGTLLSPRLVREIVDSELDKIIISLDGAGKTTYEKIRINAHFDAVIRNIKRLSQHKSEKGSPTPVIELELVAGLDNFMELPAWAELAVELQCQGLIVQKMLSHSGSTQEDFHQKQNLNKIPYSAGIAVWENFLNIIKKNGLYLTSPFASLDLRTIFGVEDNSHLPAAISEESAPPFEDQSSFRKSDSADLPFDDFLKRIASKPIYCTQPWSIIYLTWKGEIRTCCFNEYSLGNIDSARFHRIWNGRRYRKMRNSVKNGIILDVCKDCVEAKLNYNVIKSWQELLR